MIYFPNCKINLGLSVTNKRKDGYHDLETVFYPVAVTDILEITACSKQDKAIILEEDKLVIFSATGLPVDGDKQNNLCIKAYTLIKKEFPDLPSVKMHLHKVIPLGAGLGGGSANAAFTLRLLNEKFNLNLTNAQLINYAVQLGSDCPFFIINKPCYATSRGEMMEMISLDLSAYTFVLVNCGIHINTGWAFSQISRNLPRSKVKFKDVILQPVISWKHQLMNDFERPVFEVYPVLKSIKEALYDKGALFSSMSGSGSTIFGIFPKADVPEMDFPPEYTVIYA